MSQGSLKIGLLEMFNSRELGGRFNGRLVRNRIVQSFEEGLNVLLDFSGIKLVTQGFVDEMLGVLIRQRGPDVLDRITFMGCKPSIKSVIAIVTAYSADAFEKNQCAVASSVLHLLDAFDDFYFPVGAIIDVLCPHTGAVLLSVVKLGPGVWRIKWVDSQLLSSCCSGRKQLVRSSWASDPSFVTFVLVDECRPHTHS